MKLKKYKKTILSLSLVLFIFTCAVFFLVPSALAQIDPAHGTFIRYFWEDVARIGGYQDPATISSTSDVVIILTFMVRIVLGLVGTIFILIMIYAGIMWMTAQGNSEKVEKAKSTIREAIYGIIIVLTAYAITYFITKMLTQAVDQAGGWY